MGRRWWWIAVVALVLVILSATPAVAHTCGEEPTIRAGVDAEIEVGVLAGDQASSGFAVVFDESFEVIDAQRSGPWVPDPGTNTIDYTGGTLEPGACVLVGATVRASTEGTFRVRVPQQTAAGTIVEYPPDGDLFAQPDGTYVQVNRNGPPNPVFEQVIRVTPGHDDTAPVALFAVLFIAVAVALGWLWRSSSKRPMKPGPR